ncbi:unnamed protein product [Lactuca virosa]|uniref:Uncharacterized protein n=1 Tax=Lactuca virosa TaxID=75947 RepID=A0AAU9LHF1_9ASTR|nr:unnamed protein product [Lactuca virosa]
MSHTIAVLYDSPFSLYTSASYGGLAEGLSVPLTTPFPFPNFFYIFLPSSSISSSSTSFRAFLFLRNPRIGFIKFFF